MNKKDIFESLASLSIEQLNKLHLKIEQKVAEKKPVLNGSALCRPVTSQTWNNLHHIRDWISAV
ncbi:hypothetical protein [Aliamphritea spongicola]|nr:hypothetical protein [Aliamphritea spongicola]